MEHLKNFGFEWNQTDIGLRYRIEIDDRNNKLKKQLILSKTTRKLLTVDTHRIWNIKFGEIPKGDSVYKSRLSFSPAYLFLENYLKRIFNITNGGSKDFTNLTLTGKMTYLFNFSKEFHKNYHHSSIKLDNLYTSVYSRVAVLRQFNLQNVIRRCSARTQWLFVLNYCHENPNYNFLRGLTYVGEKKEIDQKGFTDVSLFGRRLYEYRSNKTSQTHYIDLERFHPYFPDKFINSMGFTIHGFSFIFKNGPNNLKNQLNPSDSLINIERGIEDELFYESIKKDIKDKIKEYDDIPTKNYINESYL